MQIWRYVLAGSVVTALAFIPQGTITRKVAMPSLDENPTFASLKLQKHTPANVLPARSPVSFFSARQNKPLSGVTICIDPGHGGQRDEPGYTGGTVGVVTKQTESDVNLRVALLLRQYLQVAGANVVMTRISDDRCQGGACLRDELDFRTNTAKRAGADYFISVHHNETSSRETNYTSVFFPKARAGSSVPLAQNISNAVSSALGIKNVGAKSGDYRVLNQLNGIPGCIVEASFMSNPKEDLNLANLAYNKREARAIATGVLNYFIAAKGTQVNIEQLFAQLDGRAQATQQVVASAPQVRQEVVERKSMFNTTYEQVTVDQTGRQVARRSIGSSALQAKAPAVAKEPEKLTVAKPSPQVEKFVEESRENAKSLSKSNKARVVLTERNKAIGTSRPVI